MKQPRLLLIGAMLGASVVSAACASGSGSAGTSQPTLNPELERLEALYRAREDSARMNVSEADAAFMSGMIHHHAQALVMSGQATANGAGPAVQRLTSRILNAQKDEIAVMQRWLRERGLPVPEVAPDGRMPAAMGMDHSMHMPGMLSPQQLDGLAKSRGVDFDRLFLTYMIQHHNGAVTMVHELFATDGAAQDEFVFKLASDIQADQTTEVARMQQMLDALPTRDFQ